MKKFLLIGVIGTVLLFSGCSNGSVEIKDFGEDFTVNKIDTAEGLQATEASMNAYTKVLYSTTDFSDIANLTIFRAPAVARALKLQLGVDSDEELNEIISEVLNLQFAFKTSPFAYRGGGASKVFLKVGGSRVDDMEFSELSEYLKDIDQTGEFVGLVETDVKLVDGATIRQRLIYGEYGWYNLPAAIEIAEAVTHTFNQDFQLSYAKSIKE